MTAWFDSSSVRADAFRLIICFCNELKSQILSVNSTREEKNKPNELKTYSISVVVYSIRSKPEKFIRNAHTHKMIMFQCFFVFRDLSIQN